MDLIIIHNYMDITLSIAMPNVQLIYKYIKIIDYTVLINPY